MGKAALGPHRRADISDNTEDQNRGGEAPNAWNMFFVKALEIKIWLWKHLIKIYSTSWVCTVKQIAGFAQSIIGIWKKQTALIIFINVCLFVCF